jgi:hypothetical protein
MHTGICPITGLSVTIHQRGDEMSFYYETPRTGPVAFTDLALMQAGQLSPVQKQILAGICRNRYLQNKEPVMIRLALLNQLNDQDIPYGFEERARHFLQFLMDNGGKEYRSHNLNSANDSAITYSSPDEFERIIRFLKGEGWLAFDSSTCTAQGSVYQGLNITKNGMFEIKKDLPQMPLFSLVDQKVRTGDPATDAVIEHARALFFDPSSSHESKRSACESLHFVLEPLRYELNNLVQGDTAAFFNIVNSFNIRHNKENIKKIEHQEQLEWVFYSLLNTLTTYVKMKKKLN